MMAEIPQTCHVSHLCLEWPRRPWSKQLHSLLSEFIGAVKWVFFLLSLLVIAADCYEYRRPKVKSTVAAEDRRHVSEVHGNENHAAEIVV